MAPQSFYHGKNIFLKKENCGERSRLKNLSPRIFLSSGVVFSEFSVKFSFSIFNFFCKFFTLFKSIEIFFIHDYFTIRF